MSYNQEMKKAIHAYMKSIGFKYYPKLYSFVKTIDEDLEISIINGHSYDGVEYQITPSLHLISKSFNELLKDLTEGHYDDNASNSSLFYKEYYSDESRREGGFVYSMKFTSKRSMEENMADYKHVIEDELLVWAEKYSNQEVLYRDILSGKYNGGKGWDNDNYYSPLICYVQKDYAKALEYIDFFLKQKEEKCQQRGNPPTLIDDCKLYTTFHNNLKALIESQPDYKPEGGMSKLAKNIKKLFSVIIHRCMELSAKAQTSARGGATDEKMKMEKLNLPEMATGVFSFSFDLSGNSFAKVYVPDFKSYKVKTIAVYSEGGELMLTQNIESANTTVTLSEYPKGIYKVRLQLDDSTETFECFVR